MNIRQYTLRFLEKANYPTDDKTINIYIHKFWVNTQIKDDCGLRLTFEGYEFLTKTLDVLSYDILFPLSLDLKPRVILFLDKFITCPYYLTNKSISVFNDRVATNLILFSGDVARYGFNKASQRQYPTYDKFK